MFEHPNTKKRTKRKSSARYIFAKAIEIHVSLWYNKSTAKVARFQPFYLLCRDTTFDITLKVEWVELTEYSPKSDIKTHENAPKRPQLKDALSNGNKPVAYSHSIDYDCLTASYDTLCVVIVSFAKL